MTIEIRSCRDEEELQRYGDIVAYVFAANDRDDISVELKATDLDRTTCAFVDGTMATTMGGISWDVQLNGRPVPMAGVTAVGTLPTYRRRGLLRKVMYEGLAKWRDEGRNYAILWASMGAIYQRFGYGIASSLIRYDFDPKDGVLAFPKETTGTIRLKTPTEARGEMEALYGSYIAPRNLAIHRSVFLWEESMLRPKKKGEPVYVAVSHDGDGEPRGYLAYQTRENQDGSQVLRIKDFIYADMDAYRALWEYMLAHDLVKKITMQGNIGTEDPAPSLLLEPRALNRWEGDGIWMRIVDVEKGLRQRPYGAAGRLNISVADAMCDWNNATFSLETNGPSAEARRTTDEPDLTMTPNSLATLVAGHRPATFLHRIGLIEAKDRGSLALADGMFATDYAPHCLNDF
jgi:predicted acetyltransferase